MSKTSAGPLREQIQKWIKEFRHSEFKFESPDLQLAGFITERLQKARPALLNPDNETTWKHCSLCGAPMNPEYDPSGTANSGNNCCGR